MKLTLLSFSTLFIFGCAQKHSINDFEWLEGNWIGGDSTISFYENWKFDNENSMTGLSGAFQLWDTVFKETLKIENIEGNIFYIENAPKNQAPVHFKLTQFENREIIFENLKHNFPHKITYRLQLNGMLHIQLEGIKDGKKAKEELTFIKTK